MTLVTLHYLTYSTYFGFQTLCRYCFFFYINSTKLQRTEQLVTNGDFTDLAILWKLSSKSWEMMGGKKKTNKKNSSGMKINSRLEVGYAEASSGRAPTVSVQQVLIWFHRQKVRDDDDDSKGIHRLKAGAHWEDALALPIHEHYTVPY